MPIVEKNLPISLWNNNRFEIPETLTDSLWLVLEKHELLEMSKIKKVPSAHGGVSKEDTDEYLAKLCAVSSVRPMSVFLDPFGNHQLPGEILRECTHQGKLALIDFPSGCGTTTLGMLTAVEQMRRTGHLISFDLEVEVLALDISPRAFEHFRELLHQCRRKLEKELIKVNLTTEVVDVREQKSVSTIINDWVSSVENDVDYILVLASAFSGFATQAANRDSVVESFKFIKERLYTEREQSRFLVWLETKTNSGVKFFNYLSKAIGLNESINSSEYKFMNPFQKEERRCNLQSGCVEITRPPRRN